MPWDASRRVPWKRLVTEWVFYIGVMIMALLVLARDKVDAGVFLGLLVSGPLYIGAGALLAKYGYQRKTLRELRLQSAATRDAKAAQAAAAPKPTATRAKPAPTKRTSGGGNRPSNKPKR